MKKPLIILFNTLLLLASAHYEAQGTRHEVGLNFAKSPQYESSVWDESGSFLQVLSPITYKYFFDQQSALRVSIHSSSNEYNLNKSHAEWEFDSECHSISVGYQKILGLRKIRPYVFGDLAYVNEDYYRFSETGFQRATTLEDYKSNGVSINGGLGVRYEFSKRFCLAYEANLGLYTRNVNGLKYESLGWDNAVTTTSWNDAILTNLRFNPISNLSINYKF